MSVTERQIEIIKFLQSTLQRVPNQNHSKQGFLTLEKASDSNAGAIYKIRAVLNGKGLWDGVVRCGSSGELLFEHCDLGSNWEVALINITNQFSSIINESCKQLFSFVFEQTKK